mgnify:CR=1 FL=1
MASKRNDKKRSYSPRPFGLLSPRDTEEESYFQTREQNLKRGNKMSIKQMIIRSPDTCYKDLNIIREEYPFLIEVGETNDKIMGEFGGDVEFLCPDEEGGGGGGGIPKDQSGGADIPQGTAQIVGAQMVADQQRNTLPAAPPDELSTFLADQEGNYRILVVKIKGGTEYMYCSLKDIGNYITDAIIVGMVVKYNFSLTVAIYHGSTILYQQYAQIVDGALSYVISTLPDVGLVSYLTKIGAGLLTIGYDMGVGAVGMVVVAPAVAKGVLVVCACILAYLIYRYLRKVENVELTPKQLQEIEDAKDVREMNEMIVTFTENMKKVSAENKAKAELQGTMAAIEQELSTGNTTDAMHKYLSNFLKITGEDWSKTLLAGKIIVYLDNLVRNKTLLQVKNIAGDLKIIFELLFTTNYDGTPIKIDERTRLLALEIQNVSAEVLKLSVLPRIALRFAYFGDIARKKTESHAKTITNTLMENLGNGITNLTDLVKILMPGRIVISIPKSLRDNISVMTQTISSKFSATGGSASRRRRKLSRKSSRKSSRKPRNKRKTIRKKVSKTRKRTLNKKSKKRSKKLRR